MITFVTLLALMWVTEHIDESVFVISFQENVVVFKESKDCAAPSSVFACVYSTLSIQV